MEIQVTQEDIDNGTRADPFHCPLARAIKRTLGIDTVSVGGMTARTGSMIHSRSWLLEPDAREFVAKFDGVQPGPVAPGTVHITYEEVR